MEFLVLTQSLLNVNLYKESLEHVTSSNSNLLKKIWKTSSMRSKVAMFSIYTSKIMFFSSRKHYVRRRKMKINHKINNLISLVIQEPMSSDRNIGECLRINLDNWINRVNGVDVKTNWKDGNLLIGWSLHLTILVSNYAKPLI